MATTRKVKPKTTKKATVVVAPPRRGSCGRPGGPLCDGRGPRRRAAGVRRAAGARRAAR
jgi:hypothetical protein